MDEKKIIANDSLLGGKDKKELIVTEIKWTLRKIWAHKPFVWLQRCCICGKLGVKTGIHSYWHGETQGKICQSCEIDMLTMPKEVK